MQRLSGITILIGLLGSIIIISTNWALASDSPCLAGKDIPMKNGFLLYENDEHHVQIQYPLNWVQDNDVANGEFTAGNSTLYALTTLEPNTPDGFRNILELEINDISNYPDDLKSFAGMTDSEKEYILLGPQAKIISSSDVQLNGCPAHQFVYLDGTPDKKDLWKIMQTFFVDCDKEYVLRYTATPKTVYSDYLGIVKQMIQTYKVSDC